MRVWNVRAWAGRAAPSSRTSGKRNKQGTPETGLQDKKSAHERETLAPRTKTQLRRVRIRARPVRTEAVLLHQNQTQPRTVGAPAPGANTCPPVRTEAVLLHQNQSQPPNRRSTRPGCEYVPARSHRGGAPTPKPKPTPEP